jgi:predicted peptidase
LSKNNACSLKLPAGYNPTKKYPLLVFLHGSGVTEENLLNDAWSNGSFIELAPLGHDIYGCYDSKAAQ